MKQILTWKNGGPFTLWITPVVVYRHIGICGMAVVVSQYLNEVHTKPWVGLESYEYRYDLPKSFVMNGKSYFIE